MTKQKTSPLPRLNISAVEKTPVGNGKNFEATVRRFTGPLQMKNLGCGYIELAPGKKAWPYHLHYGNEEMFLIQQGTGLIRYDDEMYDITAGDVIYTPAGDGTAHQIINNSDQPLCYFAISTLQIPDICHYPDSRKYGAYYQDGTDDGIKSFIAKESSQVDYFEDEEDN
tara:strand:+ start:1711 stop:2217 length:507 start_codon:yes stop_codon:yes gene_type:complete